jgi:hypothetical protein
VLALAGNTVIKDAMDLLAVAVAVQAGNMPG